MAKVVVVSRQRRLSRMQTRITSRLNTALSVIGQGCWQLGADWGDVAEDTALEILVAALDNGVTFLDTADVYGDGRSEKFIGTLLADRGWEGVTVATKMGRRANPHTAAEYNLDNFRAWNDRSRENLGVDTLDLVQLHCPPTPVYSNDQTYDDLDLMVSEGRMKAYGVSVETCAEALTAIARPNVASVQIIVNAFRQKPLEEVLPVAAVAGVAIIARVPLASGLLSGRFDLATEFAENDHRNFNREGKAFDVGETFAGVPYELGVQAAQEFGGITALEGATSAQRALRWLIDQPGITTVIPGASTPAQAAKNAQAALQAPLSPVQMEKVTALYNDVVRPHVHARW